MKTKIQKLQQNITLLAAFVERYPLDLPQEIIFISCGETPNIEIRVSDAPNEHGRLKILATVGDVIGRVGWKAEYDKYESAYNWKQDFFGVKVKLTGAEPYDIPPSMPVQPSKFPVLLEDSK